MPTYTDLKKKGTTEIVYPNIKAQNIPNSAITESKIAPDAVTNSKIATGAVSETKIDAYAVSTVKIQNGAITTDKLGPLAVKNSKIANSAVTKEKLNLYTYDIGSALAGATLETLDDVLNWFQVEIIDNLLATELFLTCYRINVSGGEYEFESCSFTYDTANSEVSFAYDHGGTPVRIVCDNDMSVAQFLQDVQGVYIVTLG